MGLDQQDYDMIEEHFDAINENLKRIAVALEKLVARSC
jgi:hypothetical protein